MGSTKQHNNLNNANNSTNNLNNSANNQNREILCWILGVNIRAHKRKAQLEKRLREIKAEEDMPIGGINYNPLPRGSGSGSGAAGIIFKLDEIEERILKQKASIQRAIIQVMDILEYLPEDSNERQVCELRYIDRMSIDEAADEVGLSRSGCYKVHDNGIQILLQQPRVQKIIEEHRLEYLDYSLGKQLARVRKDKTGRTL